MKAVLVLRNVGRGLISIDYKLCRERFETIQQVSVFVSIQLGLQFYEKCQHFNLIKVSSLFWVPFFCLVGFLNA